MQKKGYTISMIQEALEKEKKEKSARKILVADDEVKFCGSFLWFIKEKVPKK